MEEENSSLEILLHNLGFLSSASKLYFYILRHGKTTSSELATEFSLPDIETGLRWLEENRVILRQVDAEQKEHVSPINPQIVSRSLYSRFLWSYVPSEGWLSRLSKNKLKLLTNYYKVCCAFSKKFTPIYQKYIKSVESISGLEMVPKERLPNVLSSILSTASSEILGITVFPWTPSIELVWETLKERIASGVEYRRIADEITLVAFGHIINCRDISKIGVNLRVLSHREIPEKFYLVDNRRAFVFFPGSPPQNFKLEGMKIVGGPLIQMYKETFERMWDRGILGSDAIRYMEILKKDFLKKATKGLREEERDFVEGLFDYGKFFRCEYSSCTPQRITYVLKFLARNNYVIPFPDSEVGFIPNLMPVLKKFMETGRNEK